MRFNHVGIPTTTRFKGEIDLPRLKVTVSDHQANPFGIQWMRYWEDAPYPDLVKTVAHVAFEVEDLEQALRGHEVIIPPNSPSAGVISLLSRLPAPLWNSSKSIGLSEVISDIDWSMRPTSWFQVRPVATN